MRVWMDGCLLDRVLSSTTMGRVLRSLSLSAVPLLMLSLAGSVVDAQSFSDDTPRNFRELFVGRCEEYQRAIFPHWIDQ